MTAAEQMAARSLDLAISGGQIVFGEDGSGGAWYSSDARPYVAGCIVCRYPLTARQAEEAIMLQAFRNKYNRPNADRWDMISDSDGTL